MMNVKTNITPITRPAVRYPLVMTKWRRGLPDILQRIEKRIEMIAAARRQKSKNAQKPRSFLEAMV